MEERVAYYREARQAWVRRGAADCDADGLGGNHEHAATSTVRQTEHPIIAKYAPPFCYVLLFFFAFFLIV
jgi:hypothetical protein